MAFAIWQIPVIFLVVTLLHIRVIQPDFARLKRLIATCTLLTCLSRADSVVLTGLGSFGGRQVAYFYFPESGRTAEVSLTSPQRNIQLVAMDAVRGTVQIRRDGVDQTLRLGVGMTVATSAVESAKLQLNRPVPDRTREEQRRLDMAGVDHARKLNEIGSRRPQPARSTEATPQLAPENVTTPAVDH